MRDLVAESDVMALLKSSTADLHRSVEQIMPFFRAQFSLRDYTQTLAAFLGFFGPVEQIVRNAADWSAIDFDINRHLRAHRLESDLLALGLSDPDISNLPRCTSLPNVGNRESALGCLYVLEGSTLGGQIIGRELAQRFGIDRFTGASFFLSHGSRVGEMWKEFSLLVRSHINKPDSQQLAVQAAMETFSSLEAWMRKVIAHA